MTETNEKWLYRDLTQKIIGAAMEVHRELGSGFLEYVYEEALCYELNLREISFERQKEIEEAQLLNYLKATKMRLGLLLNFGAKSLEVKRRIL